MIPAANALEKLIIHDAIQMVEQTPALRKLPCLVLDDASGALTAWAVRQDFELVLLRNANFADATHLKSLHPSVTVAGVDTAAVDLESFLNSPQVGLVVGRLPKSLLELTSWIKALASAGVGAVVLGGNTKHMSTAQTKILASGFTKARGGLGKGKFRCLHASGAMGAQASFPRGAGIESFTVPAEFVPGGSSLQLQNIGGVFGAKRPDLGGLTLAEAAIGALNVPPADLRVLDLGCGNGLVLALVGKYLQATNAANWQLLATDIHADAVESARLNLEFLGDRALVQWDNAAAKVPDQSQDLVLLNPPFHQGNSVDSTLVEPLLSAAQRVLKAGGKLLFVHNSHLRYRHLLEARFAQVRQISRNSKFTVLEAARA